MKENRREGKSKKEVKEHRKDGSNKGRAQERKKGQKEWRKRKTRDGFTAPCNPVSGKLAAGLRKKAGNCQMVSSAILRIR